MEYNPLTSLVRARREDLDQLRRTDSELRLQLEWHGAFDPAVTDTLATVQEAKVADLALQLEEIEKALANATGRLGDIRAATRPSWNPRYWFSATRSTAKSDLTQCIADIKRHEADRRRCVDAQDRAVTSLAEARESLQRYSGFDRRAVEDELAGLEAEIRSSGVELDKLESRESALNMQLEAPKRQLSAYRSEVEGLKNDRNKARRFDRRLGEAKTAYERKQIHIECELTFGTGSPGKVIEKSNREIASKERNIAKLERRLQEIGRRGTLDVQALVIDGSNLCYEADRLIGLFALRALCARLADDFQVTVIFDASIKARLGMPSDDALRSQLPGVKVHITAPQTGADETILDAAENPTVFVVSNDRFADFPDKSAVRDTRLIRHQIINGRVLVPDLSIDVEFSNRR